MKDGTEADHVVALTSELDADTNATDLVSSLHALWWDSLDVEVALEQQGHRKGAESVRLGSSWNAVAESANDLMRWAKGE